MKPPFTVEDLMFLRTWEENASVPSVKANVEFTGTATAHTSGIVNKSRKPPRRTVEERLQAARDKRETKKMKAAGGDGTQSNDLGVQSDSHSRRQPKKRGGK